MMRITLTIALLLTALAAAGAMGCADVRVRPAPDYNESAYAPAAASTAPNDGRTAEQLRQENQQLRDQLATFEQQNHQWNQAVEGRKREIRELKDQRDALKKERDRYKDRFEGD